MNTELEERFIRSFIDKRLQDRLIFELASKKNRLKAVSRFSHNVDEILNNKYIVKRGYLTDIDFEKVSWYNKVVTSYPNIV